MLLGSRTKRTSLVNSTTQTSIFKLGQFLASPISGTFMFASHVNCGCCRLSLIFVTSWRAARVAISDWWVPTSQLIFNHHFSHLSNNFHYCQIQFPQNICNQILILKKYHPIPLSLSLYIYIYTKYPFRKKPTSFPGCALLDHCFRQLPHFLGCLARRCHEGRSRIARLGHGGLDRQLEDLFDTKGVLSKFACWLANSQPSGGS